MFDAGHFLSVFLRASSFKKLLPTNEGLINAYTSIFNMSIRQLQ